MKLSIQNKLKEKNMTRYELAKKIGVTYPTIDKIYKGESTSIKFDILESICKELFSYWNTRFGWYTNETIISLCKWIL